MIYRDQLERCPRCSVELIQAGSARACTACRGLWVSHSTFGAMVANMNESGRPKALPYVAAPERAPLACPACAKPMQTWTIYAVPIDRCAQHGVWFDRDELERVLYATSDVTGRRIDE